MPALSCSTILILCHLWVCVNSGTFVEPAFQTMFSVAEKETRLPCQFQPSEGASMVQVIWTKEKSDGTSEQIITANHVEGQEVSPDYEGRVRFEGSDPMVNSALIIMKTKVADEGQYTCTVTAFPSGKFNIYLSLTVWMSPISNLEPVVLVEGQSFRPAATCSSVAKPPPGLSWDTDLPGQSQNRSLENEASFIQFSLHPLRSMNGYKLDCLVWHPTLKIPRRHRNQLVVHYPPNAVITGYDGNWYAGLEGATLQCDGEGNPKPENFTWTRKDGGLPVGVTVEKGLLRFNRPLALTDKGVYECIATNVVSSAKCDLEIAVKGGSPRRWTFDGLLLIIIGSVAALLVVMLVTVVITVNKYYKRKNKQLSLELNEKREEISTLSRQASFRRVSSINTENKYQMIEDMPSRVDGMLHNSLCSLERPCSRDSQSTFGGTVDTLGRPAIYNTSRRVRDRTLDRERDGEREVARLKVESFVKNSNMSLVHSERHFVHPLQPSPYPLDQNSETVRSQNGGAILPSDGRPQTGEGSRSGSQTGSRAGSRSGSQTGSRAGSRSGSQTGSRSGSQTGSRAGSRGHQSPLNSSKYPTLTDEEEDDHRLVDEDSGGLGVPAEMDCLDNGDSETASSQISEAMSNHFEHTNGSLWPKSKPNNILLSPETMRLLPTLNSIINHQPQIV